MKNFVNDFKIYCENVEDTKGLEIIQRWIISQFYNLETFIDDNYDICNDDIEEGFRLSKLLYELASEAKKIKDLGIKEVWRSFEILNVNSMSFVREIFTEALVEACEFLQSKYNLGDNEFLTEEIANKEQWYKNLCLLDKIYFSDSWVEIE